MQVSNHSEYGKILYKQVQLPRLAFAMCYYFTRFLAILSFLPFRPYINALLTCFDNLFWLSSRLANVGSRKVLCVLQEIIYRCPVEVSGTSMPRRKCCLIIPTSYHSMTSNHSIITTMQAWPNPPFQ